MIEGYCIGGPRHGALVKSAADIETVSFPFVEGMTLDGRVVFGVAVYRRGDRVNGDGSTETCWLHV